MTLPDAVAVPATQPAPRLVATYTYADEADVPLFLVERWEPGHNGKSKRFIQRRPDGTPSIEGVRRVLYNLRAVLDADQVLVVEGEKVAVKLNALGYTATCNPGGAGKWEPSYGDALRGKNVVIFPDNDAPGMRHAHEVAAQLGGVARTVRVVNIPGMPEKGDLYDWFAAGHTTDELDAILAGAPAGEMEAQAKPYDKLHAILTRQSSEDAPIPLGFRDLDVLLGGGLKQGQVMVLAARPGVGKSALLAGACYNVARSGRTVGLFTLEMSGREVAERINRYGPVTVDDQVLVCDRTDLDADTFLAVAKEMVADGAALIGIDYLQLMKTGKGPRVQEIGNLTRTCKLAAKELGVPIILLSQMSRESEKRDTHEPQLTDLRDSGEIEQDADIVAFIMREELYDPSSVRRGLATIAVKKQRNGPVGTIALGFHAPTTRFYTLSLAPAST